VNAKEGVRGQTALMWAVLENHPAVVKLLLANGADVNAQTNVSVPDGTTGVPQATSADIGAHAPGYTGRAPWPTPFGAMTPLLFAAREGNLEMARILVDAKADLERPSANGTRPLAVAITNNPSSCIGPARRRNFHRWCGQSPGTRFSIIPLHSSRP